MSHGTKIVPSRDALRALRTLAFSTQAAFVAATGSVCGLVAIHHQQRGKVRLAEQILETKRTIHTLSQGRGNAQATRMFEAAEKGEDFTLHHGRPKKPRRTRRYATNAALKPAEDIYDTKPFNHSDDIVKEKSHGEQAPSQILTGEVYGFKPWIQHSDAVKKGFPRGATLPRQEAHFELLEHDVEHTQHDPDQVDQDPPSAFIEPSNEIRSIQTSRLFGNKFVGSLASLKAKEYERSIPGSWSETIEEAKKRLRERWAQQQRNLPMERSPVLEQPISPAEQTYTDLNPVPLTPTTPLHSAGTNTFLGLSTEESLFFNFVFDRPMPDSMFETNIFKTLQPWSANLAPEIRPAREDEAEERPPKSNTVSNSIAEQLDGNDVAETPDSGFKSMYDEPFIFKSFDDIDRTEGYFAAFDSIARAFKTEGESAAMNSLEHHLNMHYSSALRHKRSYPMLLLRDISQFITYNACSPALERVVRRELSRDVPNLNAVSLLYRTFNRDRTEERKPRYYLWVKFYMQHYCEDISDPEEVISELLKILDATISFKIPACEGMVVPVLRYLTRIGLNKRAHELLDIVAGKYDIQFTFYSTSILMRGYTVAGEWPKARALMEKLHAQDLSWKKVHGYSNLLGGTVDQYANSFPPEKVYQFVEYCMAEYALVPTSAVSKRLLKVCLRARRYDLVRRWITMIQRDYSFLSTGVKAQAFASEVGLLWRQMNASCIDVLAGVRALSTGALENPFANSFRGIAAETVQRDVATRVKGLQKFTKQRMPERRIIEDVRILVEDVKTVVAHAFKTDFTLRSKLLADDLLQQVKAAVELDHVFSGNYEVQQDLTWEERHPSQESKPTPSPFSGVPHALRVARLPRIKSLITIVDKAYQSAYEGKRKPREAQLHDMLRFTVDRLEKQQRHDDAYHLIEHVYHGKYAKQESGVPFDAALFTTWLEMTTILRSPSKYREVLWNIVDAGPELKLTTELILVARVGARKTHLSRFTIKDDEALIESEYLRARLRQRKLLQGESLLKLSRWKGLHDYSIERFMAMESKLSVADDMML